MAWFQLFRFFSKAATYTPADPSAVEAAGEEGERHRAYHQQIVLFGMVFGIGGVFLGAPVVIQLLREAEGDLSRLGAKGLLAPPLLMGIAGTCFGVALACLLAPRDFLEGPLGRK